MNPSIFKAYDIRGIYPTDINEEAAYKIGKAIAVFLKPKKVAIGRDHRESSKPLFAALARGLTEQGASVLDIGLCSTQMLYFAAGTFKTGVAVMITASHNPKEYNGFKIAGKGLLPIGEATGLLEIKRLALENKFPKSKEKAKIVSKNVFPLYKKFFSKKAKRFPFKVVIDAANSMGVKEAEVLKGFCQVIPMFFELDASFPNHEANPLKTETLHDLQQKVVEEKADLGIGFDGDADRVGYVDEKGNVVPADLLTGLIAHQYKNKPIIFDLRCSLATKEEIEKAGNRALVCRVGHSFIKALMRKEKAVFAGELSCHYYFKETFNAESSTLMSLKIMQAMLESKKPLFELIAPLKRYSVSGEINSTVADKQAKMKELEERFKGEAKKILHLDGVSMYFDDWWFNVRPSNTEPLLRLNLEAKTKELMEKRRDEALAIIRG